MLLHHFLWVWLSFLWHSWIESGLGSLFLGFLIDTRSIWIRVFSSSWSNSRWRHPVECETVNTPEQFNLNTLTLLKIILVFPSLPSLVLPDNRSSFDHWNRCSNRLFFTIASDIDYSFLAIIRHNKINACEV